MDKKLKKQLVEYLRKKGLGLSDVKETIEMIDNKIDETKQEWDELEEDIDYGTSCFRVVDKDKKMLREF